MYLLLGASGFRRETVAENASPRTLQRELVHMTLLATLRIRARAGRACLDKRMFMGKMCASDHGPGIAIPFISQ